MKEKALRARKRTRMPKLYEYPIEVASQPKEGYICYTDRYWSVQNDAVLLFQVNPKRKYVAPQCNSSKHCSELVTKKLYPNADIRFIPSIFLMSDSYGIGLPKEAKEVPWPQCSK